MGVEHAAKLMSMDVEQVMGGICSKVMGVEDAAKVMGVEHVAIIMGVKHAASEIVGPVL